MATYVQDGSGWQELTSLDRPYANVGGTWQPVKNVYANVSGTWNETFAYFETSGGTSYDAGSGYAGVYFDSSGTFNILNGTRALEFVVVGGRGGNGGGITVNGRALNAGQVGGCSGGAGAEGNINQSSVTAGPQSCSITIGAAGTNGSYNTETWNGSAWTSTGTALGYAGGGSTAGGTSSIVLNGTTYSATGGPVGGNGFHYGLSTTASPSSGALMGTFYGGSGASNDTYIGAAGSLFTWSNGGLLGYSVGGKGAGTGANAASGGLPNYGPSGPVNRGNGAAATLLNTSILSSRVYIRWLI